ncbi:hypothetical protein O9G_003662 [Rozella allomycis CSF55]|uniref:Mitochondrial carrier n=1 Tax=Rozella allomycis (strain CSF55) TaxID=988480 RepID=A0A075B483_ROZAC|nr:hypothetical protein O9G_003662 [Rozella allomycis CSF55]|eukprot:EPZ36090.1 hypothetical protein O9G_003662 [Rozella allomycis CSF55]
MTIALSNTVANFVTHPIFVVQTRLMVQSALRKEKRYFGFKTIGTIIQQEGISGFFKYPSFLLFYVSAMPILQFGPTILTRRFLSGKSISIQILALILLKLGALLIRTPLETIYMRLSIQASPSFRTCVRISVFPYINAVNCLTRIIKEEGISTLYAGWRWNLVQVFLGSLKENIVLEIEE